MMLITDGDFGQTVEDVLRALGAVLDERHAQGVVLIEVPDGLVVRARVTATLDDRVDDDHVSMEQAFGHKELLAQRMSALAKRGTGHRAGRLERALRVLGRYIDQHDLMEVTVMENAAGRGWLVWHRTWDEGRPVVLTFDDDEVEQAAAEARQARAGQPATIASGGLVPQEVAARS